MTRDDIRILKPGDESALEAFLLPRVESSMFLLSNMRSSGLVDTGLPYTGIYAAAFENGEITGVVAHFWNGVLVFQAPVHLHALWRAAADASPRLISGLIGPDEQVSPVREMLRIEAASVQMDETEGLYKLPLSELLVPHALRSGEVKGRRIEASDIEVVTGWNVAFRVEALGGDDRPELWDECRASVERSLAEGRTWVLEHGRSLVASSSFNSAIAEAVQVGGVWTPPELRRRGYGRCVVASSLRDARDQGARTAILFTGRRNVPAQKAYEALGFGQIGSYRLISAPSARGSRLIGPSIRPHRAAGGLGNTPERYPESLTSRICAGWNGRVRSILKT